MPRLYAALIRHAEYRQLAATPSAHQPFPLTECGMVQAKGLAGLIRQFCDEHTLQLHPVIDSSHLLRAWQTAQILVEDIRHHDKTEYQLESYEALAERAVGSSVANLTLQQIEDVLQQDPRFVRPPPGWKADSHYCLPFAGAESLLMAGERVAGHITRRMTEMHEEEGAGDCLKVFIGHGAAFRHAAHQLGILSFDEIAGLSMHHARPIFIQYVAGDDWQQVAGEWKLRPDPVTALD